jgi:hypothetical protein
MSIDFGLSPSFTLQSYLFIEQNAIFITIEQLTSLEASYFDRFYTNSVKGMSSADQVPPRRQPDGRCHSGT